MYKNTKIYIIVINMSNSSNCTINVYSYWVSFYNLILETKMTLPNSYYIIPYNLA